MTSPKASFCVVVPCTWILVYDEHIQTRSPSCLYTIPCNLISATSTSPSLMTRACCRLRGEIGRPLVRERISFTFQHSNTSQAPTHLVVEASEPLARFDFNLKLLLLAFAHTVLSILVIECLQLDAVVVRSQLTADASLVCLARNRGIKTPNHFRYICPASLPHPSIKTMHNPRNTYEKRLHVGLVVMPNPDSMLKSPPWVGPSPQ